MPCTDKDGGQDTDGVKHHSLASESVKGTMPTTNKWKIHG